MTDDPGYLSPFYIPVARPERQHSQRSHRSRRSERSQRSQHSHLAAPSFAHSSHIQVDGWQDPAFFTNTGYPPDFSTNETHSTFNPQFDYISATPEVPASPIPAGVVNTQTSYSFDPISPYQRPRNLPVDTAAQFHVISPLRQAASPRVFGTGAYALHILYSVALLWLPSLYFNRVAKVLSAGRRGLGALNSLPGVRVNVRTGVSPDSEPFCDYNPKELGPEFEHLAHVWRGFISELTKEYEFFQTTAVLLVGIVVALLQIRDFQGEKALVATAVACMMCALLSFVLSAFYKRAFQFMAPPHKAIEWADAAMQKEPGILWNRWVMLAMPVVWLAWSATSCVACFVLFAWHSSQEMGVSGIALGVVMMVILALGAVCLYMTMRDFSTYGTVMDRDWIGRFGLLESEGGLAEPTTAHVKEPGPSTRDADTPWAEWRPN